MSDRTFMKAESELVDKYMEFKKRAEAKGLKHIVTSVTRYIKEQVALYAQGRLSLNEVNYIRKCCGMYQLSESENKYKVTWTLASKHVIDLDDQDHTNDKSKAFDFAVVKKGGQVTWDLKADVNVDNIPDYTQLGIIAEEVGLVWGGRFSNPDYCHCELKEV